MKILLLLSLVACTSTKAPKTPAYSDDFVRVKEHMKIKDELLSPGFSSRFTNEGVIGGDLYVLGRAESIEVVGEELEIDRDELIDRADRDGLIRLLDYGKLSWIRKVSRNRGYASDVKAVYSLKNMKGKYLYFIDFECVSRLIPQPDLKMHLHRECRTLHSIPLHVLPTQGLDDEDL